MSYFFYITHYITDSTTPRIAFLQYISHVTESQYISAVGHVTYMELVQLIHIEPSCLYLQVNNYQLNLFFVFCFFALREKKITDAKTDAINYQFNPLLPHWLCAV